jgi:tryptophan-rich sensory protein
MRNQFPASSLVETDPIPDQTAVKPAVKTHWRSLLLAFALSFAVAGIGGSLTVLDAWYFGLNQPAWKPPDPAFGVIWSVIFSLCAVSGWLGWHACADRSQRRTWLVLWFLNAFFNIFWSQIYFQWHRPDWSLMELPFIWLTIGALMVFIYPRRRLAAGLLLPYVVWVSAAGVLNHDTVVLNGPFGTQKVLLERQPGE